MSRGLNIVGQGIAYLAFAAVVGVFASTPAYRPLPPDTAMIRLSFSHPGQRVVDCRTRTAAELRDLAANMRAPQSCPRERHAIKVEIDLDGRTIYSGAEPPAGLSKDGPSRFYESLPVPAGEHVVAVRLEDRGREGEFAHSAERKVALSPGALLPIGFAPQRGGVTFD